MAAANYENLQVAVNLLTLRVEHLFFYQTYGFYEQGLNFNQ